jgi:phosphoserine phosphatase
MNVYDFDNTIYNGDSSVDFYVFALRKKPYLIILLPFQVFGMMLYLFNIYSKECMKETFFVFLRFLPVQKMVACFWKQNIRKIKAWYLNLKQDTDVVISASPEFLLAPLVRGQLNITLIASKIDAKTGKFFGKNCYGKEKAMRLNAMYPNTVISNFYSDSYTDAPLAEMAKNAFLVHGNTITEWEKI